MEHTSLLIEGGGMRGFFTAGALQCLVDNHINIPYVIGVSSGSLNAVGYVNHDLQSFFTNAQSTSRHFLEIRNLRHLDQGILDTDRFFRSTPEEYIKLQQSQTALKISATRAEDAKLIYWDKSEIKSSDDLILKLQASSALPVLLPKTLIDNTVYVDGGIIDSIPILEAIADGKTRHLIIATRPEGYRKKPQIIEFFLHQWLGPYPQLKKAMLTRHLRYNKTLEKLDEMEREGQILMIRPVINRLRPTEFNLEKFQSTYDDGYLIVHQELSRIQHFLNS